jgi:predicted aspartyl protease
MQLTLQDDLAFTRLTITYQGRMIDVDHVLIDTGSASTLLAAREVASLGIVPEMDDIVYAVRGVGGSEAVFIRRVDRVAVETHALTDFEIEVGSMNYGFDLNGILGMDFLTQAGAVINLRDLTLEFESKLSH